MSFLKKQITFQLTNFVERLMLYLHSKTYTFVHIQMFQLTE